MPVIVPQPAGWQMSARRSARFDDVSTSVHPFRETAAAITGIGVPESIWTSVPYCAPVAAFVRAGEGYLGWGERARLEATGPDAAARLQAWCDDRFARDQQTVAFVSLGFAADDTSVAIVPEHLRQIRGGRFVSGESTVDAALSAPGLRAPGPVRPLGSLDGYRAMVSSVLTAIDAGRVGKVVLAVQQRIRGEREIDQRFLLDRLAAGYPECATFAVDGLLGASPEIVVTRDGEHVVSQVLAGTGEPIHEHPTAATDLLHSAKDRAEHDFAVASVRDRLGQLAGQLTVPAVPQVLPLPNVTHLATEVEVRLADPAPTALQIAAMLHPTAAVGGTPEPVALQLIRQLEQRPRGRYAAPVGWMNAAGDGEFALALRCGLVDGNEVTLMAGCGIVAGSEPEVELAEVRRKLAPMLDALGS